MTGEISTRALAVFAALCLVGRLAFDAWQARRNRRRLEHLAWLAKQMDAWDRELETGDPKDCTAEGLGPHVYQRRPSAVVPISTLDKSAQRALAEIVREELA